MAEFTGWEMINSEELQDYVKQNGVSGVDEYVSSKLHNWKNVVIHFAVCGVSGAGKSSFINRIRGIEDIHPDAAEVGVHACTKEPKCYDHPSNPNIKFWDLPGIKNPIYDDDLEKYCKHVPLHKYHTYLIFVKDRLTADDLKLAKRIQSNDFEPLDSNQIRYQWPIDLFLLSTSVITKSYRSVLNMAEFISDEMINARELQEYVKKNGVHRLAEYVSSKINDWKKTEIHFAVCGVSGSGKSSFINRIRDVEDDASNAATVDVVEGTKEPQHFDHPSNPNIKFWDLPGLTDPIYDGDLEEYCRNVPLDTYDTYLIFTNNRLTADDLKLAERIRSTGKKFFFVRAKIDQDVENAKCKDATLNKIRNNISQNLRRRGLLEDEKEIFLISNRYPAEYQFSELTQAIVAILPQRQRESFILTIDNAHTLSQDTLKKKVEVLEKRIIYIATASAAAAAIPFPAVSIMADIAMIKHEVSFYISQLGIPLEGSNKFSLLSFNTQTEVKALSTALGSTMQIGGLLATYATESVMEEFARYIPFVGAIIACPMSYSATYYLLSKWLRKMEKIALKASEEILQSARSD